MLLCVIEQFLMLAIIRCLIVVVCVNCKCGNPTSPKTVPIDELYEKYLQPVYSHVELKFSYLSID
jgi:hypothetical protein